MVHSDLATARFNLREIVKQSLLLEDHLSDLNKRCSDCITKHALMIEALIDEAKTLSPSQWEQQAIAEVDRNHREVQAMIRRGDNPVSIASKLRVVRKALQQKVF